MPEIVSTIPPREMRATQLLRSWASPDTAILTDDRLGPVAILVALMIHGTQDQLTLEEPGLTFHEIEDLLPKRTSGFLRDVVDELVTCGWARLEGGRYQPAVPGPKAVTHG